MGSILYLEARKTVKTADKTNRGPGVKHLRPDSGYHKTPGEYIEMRKGIQA